jgi:predicted outer membrane repeat protein
LLSNNTFLDNSAQYGGAIYVNEFSFATMLSCILSGDSAASSGTETYVKPGIVGYGPPSTLTITYSIIAGGYPGTGNLDVDPLLNPDLTLRPGSPAIDSGGCGNTVTATDILGNPRWDIASVPNAAGGNGVDIGAYEYQGAAGTDTIVTSFTCQ